MPTILLLVIAVLMLLGSCPRGLTAGAQALARWH